MALGNVVNMPYYNVVHWVHLKCLKFAWVMRSWGWPDKNFVYTVGPIKY